MHSLDFTDIVYKVKKPKSKEMITILHGLSGHLVSGELTAIIGSSGSGKTTLLNALSGRIISGKLEGTILFNGNKRVPREFKKIEAYVDQNDVLYPNLTVRESLLYSADLRMGNFYTPQERIQRVDSLINSLMLVKCKDSVVEGTKERGISGGERKRTAIGVEILADPKLMLLDEPTSGLDSSSTETLIELVKKLTIELDVISVAVIHQPSARVFGCFDNVIILCAGNIIYCGPVKDSISYFANIGYPCPEYENPADYFIKLITASGNSYSLSNLVSSDSSEEAEVVDDESFEKLDSIVEWPNSYFQEQSIMLRRAWKRQLRDYNSIITFMVGAIITMVLVGVTYIKQVKGFALAQNKMGLLFVIIVNLIFPIIMPLLPLLIFERNTMLRERSSKVFRISNYVFSIISTKLPIVTVSSLILLIGVYWMGKLQDDAGKFFIYIATCLTTILCSFSFSVLVSALSASVEVAAVVAPLVLSVFLIYGGFLVNLGVVPKVLGWIRYISFVFYTYNALMQNEFKDLAFDCSQSKTVVCYSTGQEVLKNFDLDQVSIVYNVLNKQCIRHLTMSTTDPSAAKPDSFAIGSISKRDRSGSGDEAAPVYPVKHPTMSYAGAAKGRPAAQTVDESIYHWYTGGEKQKLKKLCMGGSECKIGCSWDQFGDNASDAVESICRQLFDLRMTMQHDRP
ncbi:hypothetical protein BB560_003888, partial [Smittium megazygosporum]